MYIYIYIYIYIYFFFFFFFFLRKKNKHQVAKKLKNVFFSYQHREGQYAAAMKNKRQNNQAFFLNPKQVYQPLRELIFFQRLEVL